MKTLLKFILIALFCISKIKSACTGTGVAQSACTGTSCKWTQTAEGTCTGGDCDTTAATTESACNVASGECTWNPPLGTCADKTCADYDTQNACNAVSTCQWSDEECSTKPTCADYEDQEACEAVSTCQWSDEECSDKPSTPSSETPNNNQSDGAFVLKSSILIFLISFLF